MSEVEHIPVKDRSTFSLSVKLGRRLPGGSVHVSDTVEVVGIETCCPYLAVHQSTAPRLRPGWAVTHIPTGYTFIHTIPTAEIARQLAGALSQIFPWKADDNGRSVQDRMVRLPAALQDWILHWGKL
jgi:hypothetical protein